LLLWGYLAASLAAALAFASPRFARVGYWILFALHMFDAAVECEAVVALENRDGGWQAPVPLQAPHVFGRIRCDPLVFWNIARHICRSNQAIPDFVDIGVLVRTRRRGQTDWHPVMTFDRFCHANPEYRLLGHNDWIQIDPQAQ
jgi:hypothetical protein